MDNPGNFRHSLNWRLEHQSNVRCPLKTKLKTSWNICGIALAWACALACTLKAQDFYVTDAGGTVGEYGLDGSTVNASLITGFSESMGIALCGTNLFVTDANYGTVGEYTTSGQTVNASLITGLNRPSGIAVSGTNIFVSNEWSDCVAEYTTSGTLLNAALITGLDFPNGIAISGTNLFVANINSGTVGEYTTSGATVNASLITGLMYPEGLTISGNELFIADSGQSYIPVYTTSGAFVTSISGIGLQVPLSVAVYGNDVFVSCGGDGYFGEYTSSGATVNMDLFSSSAAWGIAITPMPLPVLSSPVFSNGRLQVAVTCSSNLTYIVQSAADLLSTNWVSLLVTNPPSGFFSFTDPSATNQQRFYRLALAQ
jgi:hypothetical protein